MTSAGESEAPVDRVGVVVEADVTCDDPVDVDRWAALLARALGDEEVPAGAHVGLHLVGADAIAELNREHMGHDRPTDVLAFPIDGRSASGDDGGPPGWVGDVVVCPAVAAEQAATHAGSLDDELALLVVHGALHLVGHDHADAAERAAMQARERSLLATHHGPLAGDPWADVGDGS